MRNRSVDFAQHAAGGGSESRPVFSRLANLNAQRAGLRGVIALADVVPVHGIPPRLEVIRATILVVEIISMLPDVIAEEHAPAVHDRAVLVAQGVKRGLAFLVD